MGLPPTQEQNQWIKRHFGVDVERAIPSLQLGNHLTRLARGIPGSEIDPTRNESLRDLETKARSALQAGDLGLAATHTLTLRQGLRRPQIEAQAGASAAVKDASQAKAPSGSSAASDILQQVQFALPGPIPLPLPILPNASPTPIIPRSWENALDGALRRAGRRMTYTAQQAAAGNVGDALRHVFIPGTSFPAEVDDPDPALNGQSQPATVQMSRPVDSLGRPLAREHTQSTPMLPPGDCEPGQHAQLQADVQAMCKSGRVGCDGTMSVPQLEAQLGRAVQCGTARDRINSMCFAGGDRGHRTASDDMWKAVQRCTQLLKPAS